MKTETATTGVFNLKDDDSEISVTAEELDEIVPDADFRFSLLIMKNGDKHFVCGTEREILQKLGLPDKLPSP